MDNISTTKHTQKKKDTHTISNIPRLNRKMPYEWQQFLCALGEFVWEAQMLLSPKRRANFAAVECRLIRECSDGTASSNRYSMRVFFFYCTHSKSDISLLYALEALTTGQQHYCALADALARVNTYEMLVMLVIVINPEMDRGYVKKKKYHTDCYVNQSQIQQGQMQSYDKFSGCKYNANSNFNGLRLRHNIENVTRNSFETTFCWFQIYFTCTHCHLSLL